MEISTRWLGRSPAIGSHLESCASYLHNMVGSHLEKLPQRRFSTRWLGRSPAIGSHLESCASYLHNMVGSHLESWSS
ncbi:uncharacterized protein LOC135199912 [Macrobrachium nipponense]|uniref:uncharacterized protein LOC135199912 n=1 Tax=Macrobrachium nipponense TaxID=159736 RepID=UPI0030C85CBB